MQQLKFFGEFSAMELKEVAKVARWERRTAGDTVFAEGDEDAAFYVIADGMAELTINGTAIRDLETGECFGEMGYLDGNSRLGSVTVQRDAMTVVDCLMSLAA